jgi:hypothetical protein
MALHLLQKCNKSGTLFFMPLIPLTHEQARDHRQRLQDANRGVHLEIPSEWEAALDDLTTLVEEGERLMACPTLSRDEYDKGVAAYKNQVGIYPGTSGTIISTEHATTHWRKDPVTKKRENKRPDAGTAGLGAAVAAMTAASHVTMLGRQTGDPNNDERHPYKDRLRNLIQPDQTFISLHGMCSGYVSALDDVRSLDILVGIGDDLPEPRTIKLGEQVVSIAEQLGLRAGVNQPLLNITEKEDKYFLEVDDDGAPVTRSFIGPAYTTRGAVEQHSKDQGLGVAAVQIELVSTLRLMPREVRRKGKIRQIGPALGCIAIQNIVDSWR